MLVYKIYVLMLMKYNNLFVAYSIEFVVVLLSIVLVILFGPKVIAFLALLALRPFILGREKLSDRDEFWHYSYTLGKYSLFLLAAIIIVFYFVNHFLLSNDIIFLFKDRIIILLPLFLFIHGILGLISLMNYKKDSYQGENFFLSMKTIIRRNILMNKLYEWILL